MAVRKVMGNKKAAARPTAGLRNESKQSNRAVARAHAQQVQQRSAKGQKGLAARRAGSKSNKAATKSSTVGNSSLLKPQTSNALAKRATARGAQFRRKMGR